MISTPALVRRVVEAQDLDTLTVYDQAGRNVVFEANGAADILDALETLPNDLRGTFRLVGGKEGSKKSFTWVCAFGAPSDARAVAGVSDAGGPGWSEYIALREELLTMKLREELGAAAAPGPWDKLAEMLPDLLPGILGKASGIPAPSSGTALVNGAPAPAAAPGPGSAPDALPAEVLAAAQNVVKLWKADPDTFAQYAPVLDRLVNPAPNGKE